MRIDYTCRAFAYDRKDREISDKGKLRGLNNYVDKTEDADFTRHMDGKLARLGLRGVHLTLMWNASTEELSAVIAFHVRTKPSDEMLRELTDYVRGQITDGYGEGRIRVRNDIEIELDDELTGPSFVDDGVVVPAPAPDQLLFWAVEDGDLQAVESALTSHRANPNALGKWGKSVLHAASSRNNADIVTILLTHGADPNHVDDESFGPLSAAAMAGDVAALTLLLDAGGKPDMVHPKDHTRRMTPLAWAANRGHLDAATLLIAHGANVNAQAADGNTPLMWADTAAIAKLLLDNGADRTIRDKQGQNAREHHLAQAKFKKELGFPDSDDHIAVAGIIGE
jgi:hypothetical protein